MPSPDPRWGWRPKGLAKAPKRPYSEDDVLRMANILGISDSVEIAKLTSELQDNGHFYLVAKVDFDEGPRPNEIRAALESVRTQLQSIRSTFQKLDASSRHLLEVASRLEEDEQLLEVASRLAGDDNREDWPDQSPFSRAVAEIDRLVGWTER